LLKLLQLKNRVRHRLLKILSLRMLSRLNGSWILLRLLLLRNQMRIESLRVHLLGQMRLNVRLLLVVLIIVLRLEVLGHLMKRHLLLLT
jgi:hypothetical protein